MRRRVSADVLVAVGLRLGLAVAENLYFGLQHEPIDSHGERVDWEQIRARVLAGPY